MILLKHHITWQAYLTYVLPTTRVVNLLHRSEHSIFLSNPSRHEIYQMLNAFHLDLARDSRTANVADCATPHWDNIGDHLIN